MAKLVTTDINSLTNESSALATLNNNYNAIEVAMENTLSRDGTSPNTMAASIDMNSNRIINLPNPLSNNEPLRLQDLTSFLGTGVVHAIPVGGTTGQILFKNSNTDYDVGWTYSIVAEAGTLTGTTLAANVVTSNLTTVGTLIAGATGAGFTVDLGKSTVLGTLAVNRGGTGFAAYTIGDLLYASGAAALSKLADVAAGSLLISGGVATAPAWTTATDLSYSTTNKILVIRRTATTNIPIPGATTGLAIFGGNAGEGRIDIVACTSDAVVAFNRTNGAMTATTKILLGDQMMGLPSGGIDTNGATTMQQGGAITSYATADWSATSHPTEFRFYTIPTGSVNLLESMRLRDVGGVWISQNTTTNTPNTVAAGTPLMQLHGNNATDSLLVMDAYGTGKANYELYRAARGTAASFTATQANDTLGGFGFVGATAANTFANPLPFGSAGGAFVLAQALENFSGTNQGSNLQFYTTPLTTAVVSIALCCTSSGGISVGTSNTAKDFGLGNLYLAGGFASNAPTTKTTNYTMTVADSSLIFNGAGSLTLTLLSAATYPGRELIVRTIAAQTVVSASSNVVPSVGGAAGTAILAATAGKWAHLKSDGTNWQIMMAN